MIEIETIEDVYTEVAELHDITNDAIRRSTAEALYDAPAYFWTAPTGSYYHPDEHGARHGLLLHTKRVASAFERFADSMITQDHFTETDADCGRAACLLHDTFKYGTPPTETGSGPHGRSDVITSQYYDEEHDLDDRIINSINSHKGPWGAGSYPTSHVQQMVHVADQIAACGYIDIGVKEPSETLRDHFPNLRER